MKILMIGSGGREHALIRKLMESPRVEQIYCAPGNGGISRDAQCVTISAMDIEGVVAFSKEHQIDLVFVAPDDPLAAGMVDALEAAGVRAFGPSRLAAEIESSKVFSKNLMKNMASLPRVMRCLMRRKRRLPIFWSGIPGPLSSRRMALRWARAL